MKKIIKSIVVQKYGRYPTLVHNDISQIQQSNQKKSKHLIRMAYAPVNPSDINYYLGVYGIKNTLPSTMGFQGSGIMQQSSNKQLIGKKVSVLGVGTWANYFIPQNDNSMIIWDDSADLKQISCSIVNPLTALALRNICIQKKCKTVLISASSSTLGKMMIKIFKKAGIRVLSTVRKLQQVQVLLGIGADKVYVDPLDQISLKQLNNQNKTLFVDCVGGQFAGHIFNHLSSESTMICYGRLSKKNLTDIIVPELLFKNKKIEGFWVSNYLKELNNENINKVFEEIKNNFEDLKSPIRKTFEMQEYINAFKQSIKDQSLGKVLLDLN